MASTNEQPFRFLSLPVELQRNVFTKLYEEPWFIRALRSDRVSSYGELEYGSNLPRSPLFVSRHFYCEAVSAIEACRFGTFIDSDCSSLDLTQGHWFDDQITTVQTRTLVKLAAAGRLRHKFHNLEKVEIRSRMGFDLGPRTLPAIKAFELPAILRGEANAMIAAETRAELSERTTAYSNGPRSDVSGVVVSAQVYVTMDGLTRSKEMLDWQLCFEVSISDEGEQVDRMWIASVHGDIRIETDKARHVLSLLQESISDGIDYLKSRATVP
ncbi:hypothetical protein OHC33_005654 [Knufia fluminis]|uniref:Uncharacterized protein n=1 Tax=Knufia fluminis TaxID=191047 RepID=A0AAN8ET60_9EURO|nr:hypothetical protein OHC33_005654 [Knufia fluminis]